MKRDDGVEAYLQHAQSWEVNTAALVSRSARRDRWFGIAGLGIAALAVAAVAGLTPLKQPVPVLIRVDNSTGVVDIVPTYEGTQDIGWLVTQGLLNQYVISRERYFYGVAESDYESTAAKNSPPLNAELVAAWDRNNPQSPLNVYKDGTSVAVFIRSTTPLKLGSGRENVAQVRFSTSTRAGGGGAEQLAYWISTVEYAYGKPSTDPKQRSLNPLGFRVLEYHREPEAVTVGTKG